MRPRGTSGPSSPASGAGGSRAEVREELDPIDDLYAHILGTRPWLAADPVLGPLPATPGLEVVQTGDWVLDDTGPLPPELEAFLDRGGPPVYIGFGSMPAQPDLGRALVDAVRALGGRVVLARGWGRLEGIDDATDCAIVDQVSHPALLPGSATLHRTPTRSW